MRYSIPECSHLQRDLIEQCLLNQVHKPVNPHSQRLIVASKKATEPLPKAEKPKPKGKAKAKAKAKNEPKEKNGPKETKKREEQTEYSKAKQLFLEDEKKLAKT